MKYIDSYRKKKLGEALAYVDGNCTLHGRFRSDERGIVVASYPKYAETLLANCIDNSDTPSECFTDSAKVLADHQASLIITDERYARFGLCPNRLVEAIAVNTVPLVVPGVLDNCEPSLQSIVNMYNIDASRTRVEYDSDMKPTLAFYNGDNKHVEPSIHQDQFRVAREALREHLLKSMNALFSEYVEM
jgi:hypothetical protein